MIWNVTESLDSAARSGQTSFEQQHPMFADRNVDKEWNRDPSLSRYRNISFENAVAQIINKIGTRKQQSNRPRANDRCFTVFNHNGHSCTTRYSAGIPIEPSEKDESVSRISQIHTEIKERAHAIDALRRAKNHFESQRFSIGFLLRESGTFRNRVFKIANQSLRVRYQADFQAGVKQSCRVVRNKK